MKQKQTLTIGQRTADLVVTTIGSWRFIIIQTILIAMWIVWNIVSGKPFDIYPFVFLNLMLSFQAAYTGPLVMMSQNRQAEIDRKNAAADYSVNRIAKKEIEAIQVEIRNLKSEIVGKNSHKKRLQKLVDRLEDVQGSLASSELKPTK